MKRKPKVKLSPVQQKRLMYITLIVIAAVLFWLLFAPRMGIVSLYKERARLERLETKRVRLEEENTALRQEIDRIQNDIDYFEKLAREKHGLLRQNEVIFDFSKKDKKEKK